jgi:hypothetical protein
VIAAAQDPFAMQPVLAHRARSGAAVAALRIKEWTVTARHGPRYPAEAMLTLLDDLDAFFQDHRRCGELDGGVEDERLWMTCSCGSRALALAGRRC